MQLSSEGLAAVFAPVGLPAGVDALVSYEDRAPGEGLAALAADIRLFPGVQPLVVHRVGALAEGVATLATFVGQCGCAGAA